jgi:hypothetical protein
MLKTSKIPTGQTLETFDFVFQPAIERSRSSSRVRWLHVCPMAIPDITGVAPGL